MKKDLYLMRHGETLFNIQNKVQGWCDSPLTEHGMQQCLKAKEKLDSISFDHYYSSTSERCCDTLELVAPGVNYMRLKGLKERSFGLLEGEQQYLQLGMQHFEELAALYGGETNQQVVDRLLTTLTSIMEKPDHRTVLAVSHGGCTLGFVNYLTAEKHHRIGNCGIYHFTYEDGKFTLVDTISVE